MQHTVRATRLWAKVLHPAMLTPQICISEIEKIMGEGDDMRQELRLAKAETVRANAKTENRDDRIAILDSRIKLLQKQKHKMSMRIKILRDKELRAKGVKVTMTQNAEGCLDRINVAVERRNK